MIVQKQVTALLCLQQKPIRLMRKTIADQLADYERRHEFHHTGLTAEPEEALRMALDFEGKPVVITDSGDNTTSGATGWNHICLCVRYWRKRT